MKKTRISSAALRELSEKITADDVETAMVESGCPSIGRFFSLASAQGGKSVPEPFILINELRHYGLLRNGEPPENYEIPEYVRVFAAQLIASTNPKEDFRVISLGLSAKKSRRASPGKEATQSQ